MTKQMGGRQKWGNKHHLIWLMIFAGLQTAGCAGIGPPTVARDRFDYISAISESWKRQTLLNLVKTRYMDAPVFMDVTSVINSYALEAQLQAMHAGIRDRSIVIFAATCEQEQHRSEYDE